MMRRSFSYVGFFLLISTYGYGQPTPDTNVNQHVQYWVQTLETNQIPILRKQAARHLGNMQDPMAVQSLLKGLSDQNEDVRMQCAYSLGRLGDPSALRPLYEMIEKSKSSQIQSAARSAIDKINAHEEFKHQQKQKLKEMELKNSN